MSLIISDTTFYYKTNSIPVLNVGSLSFHSGLNFLVGKNGSGKSTLLKALSNINDSVAYSGKIELDNGALNSRNIGLVTQNPLQSINTELTFLENIILADTIGLEHISLKYQVTSKGKKKVLSFLNSFKNRDFLVNLIDKKASKLSSGQQQMLAIVMRVVRFQKVLLLDECTANLDAENTTIIINLLLELIKKGTIVIFATHQLELLTIKNSRIYETKNGEIKKRK